jgi:chitin synthase
MSMNLSKFYWILLPIYFLRPLIDFVEILTIVIAYPTRRANARQPKIPETLENLVYLLACYNETYTELMNSLNSLAEQKDLDAHNKAIIIVCDGRCKGNGMTKTTAEHLTQDVIERPSSTLAREAYTSWDGSQMNVEVVQGEFRGLPVFCIIKEENRGKRDGIILVRSFLHKFNLRNTKPSAGILSPGFLAQVSDFLIKVSMLSVEYVVGMDADTRFDAECVLNLIQTAREGEQVVGVSGYVLADFTTSKPYSIPYLYQNAEYAIGQHRRRLRQDLTSRKVTCLPGCCQLLRVIESTCGDEILGQFGYYPKEKDGLFRTIRSMMSEDRDHVCLVLRENADVEVRQCLTARAFTSVPQSFPVFLSQRRRWTLGPITSDVLLAVRKPTGWVERLAATASTFDWGVTLSVLLSRWFRMHPNTVNPFLMLIRRTRRGF